MSNAKIFLVDDDAFFIKLVVHELESQGFKKIYQFESGEACLEDIHSNPTLVLLDFSLGGLNGLDVLKRIKQASPKTDVVMITGLVDEGLRKKCFDAGAINYIQKDPDGIEILKRDIMPKYKKSGLFSFLR